MSTSILFTGFVDNTLITTKVATAEEQKEQQIKTATVERVKDGKLKISWEQKENADSVRIYWGNSSEKVAQKGNLLITVKGENSVVINDPSPGTRPYFSIKSNGESVTVAERLLSIKGATNFRDLGGYKTKDGRTVKWGYLYRSDALAGLTNEDMQYISNSGIKTVIDFRTDSEVNQEPDPVIPGINNVRLPVGNNSGNISSFDKMLETGDLSPLGEPGDMLIEMNKTFVEDPAFRELVQKAMDENNLDLLLHCTAGKDRTGFGSALLLLLLGVPEKTVMEDYLLSNEYRKKANEQTIHALKPVFKTKKDEEIFRALLDVRKEYLQASFDEIKKEYGSFSQYFEKFLGVDKKEQKEFQKMLLEK
ncbi:tyrosine-protein phosphatase [Peribacillus muralis]